MRIELGRQRRIDLDEGLKSPHAENILRDHAGLLEIVSLDGKRRRMFFATEETIWKLLAL